MNKKYHHPTSKVIFFSIEQSLLKGSNFEVGSGTDTMDAEYSLTNKKNPIWGDEEEGPWN